MVEATVVLSTKAPPIPGFKIGTLSVCRNAYTTKFGLSYCDGAIVCAGNNDDGIVGATFSSGTATITMVDDEGAAITADSTVFFIAWGAP